MRFLGVPNFAPEILRRVKLGDPMKAKKLKEALQQMAEEGVVQVFRPLDGAPALVGVVGPLQLDVLKMRLADEYGLDIGFEQPEFQLARWIAVRRCQEARRFRAGQLFELSPRTSTATACSWRATSSSSITRASARPACVFTDIKDVKGRAADARITAALASVRVIASTAPRVKAGVGVMGLAILILGLVVFLGAHVFVTFRDDRARMIARLGMDGYRALFCASSRSSAWR